jgi:hypothetical protein
MKITSEIFNELNTDADSTLSWSEFKLFIDKCIEKKPEMRELLKI